MRTVVKYAYANSCASLRYGITPISQDVTIILPLSNCSKTLNTKWAYLNWNLNCLIWEGGSVVWWDACLPCKLWRGRNLKSLAKTCLHQISKHKVKDYNGSMWGSVAHKSVDKFKLTVCELGVSKAVKWKWLPHYLLCLMLDARTHGRQTASSVKGLFEFYSTGKTSPNKIILELDLEAIYWLDVISGTDCPSSLPHPE